MGAIRSIQHPHVSEAISYYKCSTKGAQCALGSIAAFSKLQKSSALQAVKQLKHNMTLFAFVDGWMDFGFTVHEFTHAGPCEKTRAAERVALATIKRTRVCYKTLMVLESAHLTDLKSYSPMVFGVISQVSCVLLLFTCSYDLVDAGLKYTKMPDASDNRWPCLLKILRGVVGIVLAAFLAGIAFFSLSVAAIVFPILMTTSLVLSMAKYFLEKHLYDRSLPSTSCFSSSLKAV